MFNILLSNVFISPAILLVLIAYLLLRKKKKERKWEKDILDNSFNTKEIDLEYNKYSNKDGTVEESNVINDLVIYFEGYRIKTNNKIIFKNNRYYVTINDLKEFAGLKIDDSGDKVIVYIDNRKIEVDYKKNSFKTDSESCFRVPSLFYKNIRYLSLIDITEMMDLKIVWNYERKEIRLYKNIDSLLRKPRKRFKRPALIRLEDVTAGSDYATSEELQKLRIVSDLLSSRELPFHIAWIPRYMKPKEGIDNDLTKRFNMYNAEFIFTLDYMINKGGIIGLHGYSHQYEEGESGVDSEFGLEGNPSVEWAEIRAKAAIATAKQLNIPYEFFESPHYSSTVLQQKVFEKYFDYIFEPAQGVWNDIPYVSKTNKRTIYVPAPLGYVKDNNIEEMLKEIRENSEKTLGALFYHPYKEFEEIEVEWQGYPYYKYASTSMLNKILDCLEDEGYSLVKICDIKVIE
jgi:hypothetical protein